MPDRDPFGRCVWCGASRAEMCHVWCRRAELWASMDDSEPEPLHLRDLPPYEMPARFSVLSAAEMS